MPSYTAYTEEMQYYQTLCILFAYNAMLCISYLTPSTQPLQQSTTQHSIDSNQCAQGKPDLDPPAVMMGQDLTPAWEAWYLPSPNSRWG